jgi:hypothetical protein
MLVIPTSGFARSVSTHNVDLDKLCDWIEASICFSDDDAISITSVADVLVENEVYQDFSLAREMVQDAWAELKKRGHLIQQYCIFEIDEPWIRRRSDWRNYSLQAFCVMLSLAPIYDWWKVEFGSNYVEQGDLFEEVVEEAISNNFGGWSTYRTGWSSINQLRFPTILTEVSRRLNEQLLNIGQWDEDRAKDMGLDMLWHRPFADRRAGTPVFLLQCASGDNWKKKLKTPDIAIWKDLIHFTTPPQRAVAIPFALLEREFYQTCIKVEGIVLERTRLLGAFNLSDKRPSSELNSRIIEWTEQRVNTLRRRSN